MLPDIKWEDKILYINPGSPTVPASVMSKPSVGLLKITKETITPQIIDFNPISSGSIKIAYKIIPKTKATTQIVRVTSMHFFPVKAPLKVFAKTPSRNQPNPQRNSG